MIALIEARRAGLFAWDPHRPQTGLPVWVVWACVALTIGPSRSIASAPNPRRVCYTAIVAGRSDFAAGWHAVQISGPTGLSSQCLTASPRKRGFGGLRSRRWMAGGMCRDGLRRSSARHKVQVHSRSRESRGST